MQKHLIAALGGLIVVTAALSAQNDWRTYGSDSGHQRFSTLGQITPENVGQLNKAWEFDTGVKGRKWQNTPVVIDGLMYVTLQNGGVVALEPESGQELWRLRDTGPRPLATGRLVLARGQRELGTLALRRQ